MWLAVVGRWEEEDESVTPLLPPSSSFFPPPPPNTDEDGGWHGKFQLSLRPKKKKRDWPFETISYYLTDPEIILESERKKTLFHFLFPLL